MSHRSFLNDDLYDYLLGATLKPDPLMNRRALNEKIRDDTKVSSVLISIGDGLTIAREG